MSTITVDRALLEQALSDIAAARLCSINSMSGRQEMLRLMIAATDALRAALAQPEQEPVAWIHRKHYLLGHAENMPPADRALVLGWEPLYTHPPRCEWVSLTDGEISDIFEAEPRYHYPPIGATDREFARAIEAKLKEKNHG